MKNEFPPLNALRVFEVAGRHQNFNRAAEELGVSHSSVIRHVRGLEERLEVRLFSKLPRGVALTSDGAAYLARITPALEAIAAATDGLKEKPEGVISVNSEPLFATKCLVPRLGAFQRRCPEVVVRLEASRHLADVERYEADLAIRFVSPGADQGMSDLLSDAPLYPYAAPSLIANPVRHPKSLLSFPLLRDRSSGSWVQWCKAAGIPPPEGLIDSDWRMSSVLAVEAAIAGQGVLLVSEEVVSGEVAAGRLVQVSDIGFRSGGYYLVRSEGSNRRKAQRVFREWLLDETARWRAR